MARLLNDDRVGRALDELFSSDRASLLTALSLRAIRRYGIDVSELHNDSTSITLYGAYRDATGTARAGVAPPVPERGFSKDHRGDLKQLVEILTISSDGAVPIAHRLADGSTEDSTTHIATWDQLVAMLGTTDFLYTADCKLATRDNMEHIATEAGRFLTILPRSRKEDEVGRASIAAGAVAWEETARRPGKRKDDPDGVYLAAEAPSCSAEGYRIVWIRSSDKRRHDAAIRSDRIDRARIAVGELDESLRSKRSRLRTQSAVEEAVAAILTETGADRWVKVTVTDTADDEHRQERRGRPGKDTRYRRIERHRFSVSITTDAEAVSYDAASDGCFPFRHQRHAHPSRAAPQLQVPALFRAPPRNVQGGDRGGASHPQERRPPRCARLLPLRGPARPRARRTGPSSGDGGQGHRQLADVPRGPLMHHADRGAGHRAARAPLCDRRAPRRQASRDLTARARRASAPDPQPAESAAPRLRDREAVAAIFALKGPSDLRNVG